MRASQFIGAICFSVVVTGCATSNGGAISNVASRTWVANAESDPITDIERCTVIAPDRSFGRRYTRIGYYYPFVEMNSEYGLIVGIASGGSIRTSPGDIVWRVDQLPYRRMAANQTPPLGTPPPSYVPEAGTRVLPSMQASFDRTISEAHGMSSSLENGITAVDGDRARALLAEMLEGSNLIFRAASAAPSAGPTFGASQNVGLITGEGRTPIPLDNSFREALAVCGLLDLPVLQVPDEAKKG